ncbi:IPT/TIG domain-containing protein [Undibacterium sp. Ji83W]|uniref:IPT/TIG domain-containing protein n=1 Tax=Undibacterium sp. Ji83W TaxID=3413043 RepID=UPI003BF1C393
MVIQLFTARPQRALLLLVFCLGSHLASPALAAEVQYVYDKLGRLVSVVAADGNSVQYTYDAVGNIQNIQKNATTALAIAEFSPSSGSAGTTVTIFGSGFDAIAANNIVKFNGKPATVTAATANSLTANAPADVATGKITISNANGLATSSADFVVGVAAAPTITGFTPTMGSNGTVVTVSGSNYQLNKTDNKVSFGNSFAAVSSATSSSLLTSPPASPVSGKISISTPYGQAISSSDFYGLPAGVSSADIGYAGRLLVNTPATKVSTSTAGKKIVLLFEGVGQQYLSLLSTAGTFAANVNVAVYTPDGSLLVTGSILNTGNFELPKLPISGTYTILLTPGSSDKGELNLALMSAAAINTETALPLSVSAGQMQRFTFTAEAGKTFGFSLADLSFTGTGSGTKNITVYLENADGKALYNCSFSVNNSCDFYGPQWFAIAGTYILRFVPSSTYVASFKALLSKDIEAGNLVPTAAPLNLTIALAGQNGRFTFNATAGQNINLLVSGNTLPISNSNSIWIYAPSDGVSEWASYSLSGATAFIAFNKVPETGTYSILVSPPGLDKGSINLQLQTDAAGALAVDGSTNINLPMGQNGRYTFTAEAGKAYGLGITNLAFTGTSPNSKNLKVYLEKTDGTAIYNCSFTVDSSCDFYNPLWFAAGGTYVIRFVQSTPYAVSFNAVLTKDIAAGNLVSGAAPLNLTTTLPGQNGRFTFNATAGQSFNLVITGNTMPITSSKTVWIYKPSSGGSEWTSYSLGSTTAVFNLNNLPETGTYTILIDPLGLDKGSINLQLQSDAKGTLAIDTTTAVNLPMGQYGRYTFIAEAGRAYGLGLTGLNFTGTSSSAKNVTVYLEKADGTAIYNCTFTADSSCDFYNPNWFVAGDTYVVRFVQSSSYAVSFNALLSRDIEVGNLLPGAAPLNLTTIFPGQNGRFTFNATAGQSFNLAITGNTMPITSSKTVWIYKPSSGGSEWASYSIGGTLAVFNLNNLPETGTYTILIDPLGLDKGSINLQLQSDVAGTLAVEGTTVVSLPMGQYGRYTFTAEAGKAYGFGLTGLNFTGTGSGTKNLTVYLQKADGTAIYNCTFTVDSSCDFYNPQWFSAGGTYVLRFVQSSTYGVSFNALLSKDIDAGTLVQNATALTLTTNRVGQNGRFTFNATAGQSFSLAITGNTMPITSSKTIWIYKPSNSGTDWTSYALSGASANFALNNLPETGNYTVLIDPLGLSTGSVSLQLK